jgi:hypothetical protein
LILAQAGGAPGATPPAAPQGQVAAANAKLSTLADDFMHYALVNNTELAKANGEALLNAQASPEEFLRAFEETARGRNPREIMLQAGRRNDLTENASKLIDGG